MVSFGYETNASCNLKWWGKTGWSHGTGTIVGITTDGAEILCDTALSTGLNISVGLVDYEVEDREAEVVQSGGNEGAGYRLAVRLTDGSWPYQVFSTLMSVSTASTPTQPKLVTPPCLATLGLELPCNRDEIEDAFDRLVREAHPDRGGDVGSFTRLRAAYLQALKIAAE